MPQPNKEKERTPTIILVMSSESGDVDIRFDDENPALVLEAFYMLEIAKAKILATSMHNIQQAHAEQIRRTTSNVILPNR